MGYMSPDYTLGTTNASTPSLWFVNTRSMLSFIDAFQNFEEDVGDIIVSLGSDPQAADDIAADEWQGERGEAQHIAEVLSAMLHDYKNGLDIDSNIWNSLHYLTEIISNLNSQVQGMMSAFADNDILDNKFNEILSNIKSDPDFARLALVTLTRDQLMLNKSLFDSLGEANREYPYLPATKALMINQAKNLATISSLDKLVKTTLSGRKRIIAVGLPTGLVEYMRNKAIDELGDIDYRYSNTISIQVWRRNLLDETDMPDPKEFFFDTSRFIIEGRATDTDLATGSVDGAEAYSEGQSIDDLYDNVVVRGYDPEGNIAIAQGSAYTTPQGNRGHEIFENHVLDYYLKIYMMLTTGMDVFEDIFPFLESSIFFDGPDPGLEKVFIEMKEQMGEMFPTRDVTSAINYDRLVGEITRSILMSPQKWRNRIIYPKIFDRVFCVVIDEQEDFGIVSNEVGGGGGISGTTDVTLDPVDGTPQYANATPDNIAISREDELRDPTYYQYYVTISLHAPIFDTGGGGSISPSGGGIS